MKYIILTLTSLLFFKYQTANATGLNDISILLPLPKSSLEAMELISPNKDNKLLSKNTFNKFFRILPEITNEKLWNEQLRAIAIRFDPCFIEGHGLQRCRRQIRIVWQPIVLKDNTYTTRDAAIHSFYEFNEEDFSKILQQWSKISQTEKSLPLMVHPLIKEQSLNGQIYKKLREIIFKNCSESNLVRMTSMTLSGSEQLWVFSGYDIHSGVSKEINIPRINTNIQSITQSSFDQNEFWGALTPIPSGDHEFNELIDDSLMFKKSKNEAQVIKAIISSTEFENPKIHNTGTLDCASCHLANMTNQWLSQNYPTQFNSTLINEYRYKSEFNHTNLTHGNSKRNQFRIFGYIDNSPVISQRLINETIEALNMLINE